MKLIFIVVVPVIFAISSFASAKGKVISSAKHFGCEIREFPELGKPPVESASISVPLAALKSAELPGALLGKITFTTKDGLFKIDAEGLKAGNVGSNYVPIWLTDIKTGTKVAANGNPNPNSNYNGAKFKTNNTLTNLTGTFSSATVAVTCLLY